MSEILAHTVLSNNHLRRPHHKQLYQQCSVEFGDKHARSSRTFNYVLISCEGAKDTEDPRFTFVFASFSAQCSARRFKLRYNGNFEKGPKLP